LGSTALDVGEYAASCPGRFTPENSVPGTPPHKKLDGPQRGMNALEKTKILLSLPGLKPASLTHHAGDLTISNEMCNHSL